MRIPTGLIAGGLAAAAVAGCTGETGYPGSYGYPSSAYSRAPVYATPYYGPGYATSPSRDGSNGDCDRDGVPDRYQR